MRTPRLRLLSALLAVALFFTLLPVSALAEGSTHTGTNHTSSRSLDENSKDDQGLTYTLNADHTATVANYDNHTPDGVIDIPDTVTKDNIDYTVTAIGNNAFESLNVSSVFIPATVTSIGPFAFRFCKFLATVTFAEDSQLKSIGLGAFYGTEQAYPRFKEIKIPDSVETIGNAAFRYCQNLERIALPSALQTLSNVTFYGCTALSEVTFPASLETIQVGAFGYCRNLSEVELPASLKTIQSYVFGGCSDLKTVSYDGSLEQWNHITANNDVLGYSCPSLVTDDYTAQFILVENDLPDHFPKTVTITKYTGTESTVILPSTISSWPVTKIGEAAFQDNTTITSVTIPASVTEIGKLTAPTVEGYTFDGWYADAAHTTEFDFSTPITGDTTIYAKWTANDYYVSFFTEHGDPPTSQNVKYNGTATDPGKLSEEGYTFGGWYADENRTIEFDFTQPIKSNTPVYAKWTAKDYEVSFVTEHSDAPTSQNVPYNGTATYPGELTADGYTFIGWYTDDTYDTKFDFTKPITGDTKVYAKWEKNAPVLPDTYALNVSGAFVYVDGVDVTAPAGDTTLQLEKDASVRLVADPDRMPSGMVFDRWTILNGALNADDAEKFETGRTLEEFAFTMPAEPLSIEATPRMQEEEGSDTVSVIAGVTLGTAATALVAWQAYDLGMSLYQEHWLPADFVMPKTRAELALLLWNTAGRPAPAAQPAFTDITDPDTAQAAQWAVETGLMTPKSADRFKPEKSVTRWKAVRSWKRVTNQNT
ncbi:leucine-rich repeat protein [Faecalibacterium prausnitzii]|nr:leucine-rich repeat protein [Faecalibacterium prausnitzii]